MTIGIYALYWENQDKVYIGLSQNIESRWVEHSYLMCNNLHTNYKIQTHYSTYGLPSFHILEVCKLSELNSREVYWTQEFNALDSKIGLCIVGPGDSARGTSSRNSKYSRRCVLKVFSMMYKTLYTYKEIATRLGVSKSLVADIACKVSHLWLLEEYPRQYERMTLNRSIRASNRSRSETKNTKYPIIVSPDRVEYLVVSLIDFCTEHFKDKDIKVSTAGIGRVLNYTRKTYLGWKLK